MSHSVTIIMISWADVGLVNNTSLESPAEPCQTDIIGAADRKGSAEQNLALLNMTQLAESSAQAEIHKVLFF